MRVETRLGGKATVCFRAGETSWEWEANSTCSFPWCFWYCPFLETGHKPKQISALTQNGNSCVLTQQVDTGEDSFLPWE